MEKYGAAGQATEDNIMQRMRIACWITKATDIHSEYVILIAFFFAATVVTRTRLSIPGHFILLDFIVLVVFVESCKLFSSLCIFFLLLVNFTA